MIRNNLRRKKMKDLPNTDSGLFPKKYMDKPVVKDEDDITKVRITIDMDIREGDFMDLDIHLVEAYRKFSEITKGNITGGKVEEL